MTVPLPPTPERLQRNWEAIAFAVDRPPLPRLERVLRRLGVPAETTRVIGATPALRRAWYVAIAVVVVVALGATDADLPRDGLFTHLLLGPLVPVLGVALAFGPTADPAHEIALSAPMRGLRLLLVRTGVVLTVSLPVVGAVSLLAPTLPLVAFAWLLPSLALTSATLAVATWTAPGRAAAFVTVAWLLTVVVARRAADDPLAAFTSVGQLLALLVALGAAAVVVARADRFDRLVPG